MAFGRSKRKELLKLKLKNSPLFMLVSSFSLILSVTVLKKTDCGPKIVQLRPVFGEFSEVLDKIIVTGPCCCGGRKV